MDAKYYSIIFDCIPDISHQEQISFVLWCADISSTPIQVNESFLEFLKVNDRNLRMFSTQHKFNSIRLYKCECLPSREEYEYEYKTYNDAKMLSDHEFGKT